MADQVLEWATNDLLSAARLNKLEVLRVKVQPATAAEVALTLYHRDAADTANLFELRDQSAVLLGAFDDAGDLVLGASAGAASAAIDLQATTRAILLNRLTTTQRDALTPVSGMLLYNATLGQFQGYHASSWLTVGKQDLGADLGDTTVSNPGSTILLTATDGIRTTGDDTLNKITFDLNGAVIAATGITPDSDGLDLGTATLRWDLNADAVRVYNAAADANPALLLDGTTMSFGAGGASTPAMSLGYAGGTSLAVQHTTASNGKIVFALGAGSSAAITIYTDSADANPVSQLREAGIALGAGGASSTDVLLSRTVADRLDLATGDSFNVVNGAILTGTDGADIGTAALRWELFSSDVKVYNAASDANPSLRMNGVALTFGPGGATAPDVQLSRGAANRLDLADGDSFNVVNGLITANNTTAGADAAILAINADNSAGAEAAFFAQVGGASADDARIQFSIAASTKWSVGLDNSDGDAFVISESGALGTGNRFKIATGGIISPGADAQDFGTAALRWDLFAKDVNVYNAASDANPSIQLTLTTILLGPGGATAPDVQLSRGAANRLDLASGDSFEMVNGNINMTNSASTTDLSITLLNADTNAASDCLVGVNAAAAAGDAFFRVAIGSTRSYSVGIDNSDSDRFKISAASSGAAVPGSGDAFTVDYPSGVVNIGFFGVAPVAKGAAIANATGGLVADAEARIAINALLAQMRSYGLIAP